jgi:hypothetical protein
MIATLQLLSTLTVVKQLTHIDDKKSRLWNKRQKEHRMASVTNYILDTCKALGGALQKWPVSSKGIGFLFMHIDSF